MGVIILAHDWSPSAQGVPRWLKEGVDHLELESFLLTDVGHLVEASKPPPRKCPRILFFGMQGNFSFPVLKALFESDVEVCAVIVPAATVPGGKRAAIQRHEPARGMRASLPMLHVAPSLLQVAWERQVPVWGVRRLAHKETLSVLAAYQPDLICVACFSLILPPALLALPRLGCLNVHPSLLPKNRGPAPLFWTFREGHAATGVTIHRMDEGVDSGAILAQERIIVPDGIRYESLEQRCAESGGYLLVQAISNVYTEKALFVPQDEVQSSYYPFPGDEDFVVHADTWTARHVYNFIRSVDDWKRPLEVYAGAQRWLVRDAVSYGFERAPVRTGELCIPCKEGWVIVVLDN